MLENLNITGNVAGVIRLCYAEQKALSLQAIIAVAACTSPKRHANCCTLLPSYPENQIRSLKKLLWQWLRVLLSNEKLIMSGLRKNVV